MADPFSIAASVATFIQIGLKSLKTAHEILSGFKDGPRTVSQATSDVQSLTTILSELSKCKIIREDGGDNIRREIGACLDDILAFERSLESMRVEAGAWVGKRWRKKFAAMWHEKALSKTSARLLSQMASLNLHLNALQSDVLADIPTRLDHISRDLASQQNAASSIHRTHLIQNTSALSALETRMTTLGGNVNTMQAALQAGFSGTAVGHQEIMSVLSQILAQVSLADRSAIIPAQEPAQEPPTTEQAVDENKPCQQLLDTITQLCSFVGATHQPERTAHEKTRDITGRLISAIDVMRSKRLQQAFIANSHYNNSCSRCKKGHLDQLKQSLDTVYGSLLTTRMLSVNETVPKKQQPDAATIGLRETKLFQYRTHALTMSILVSNRRSKSSHQSLGSNTSPQDESDELVVRLHAITSGSAARLAMTLEIRQIHSMDGIFSSVPHLSVNNVLPATSRVFFIVKEGLLDEFKEMLSEGEVSLRDQDEYGASLLHASYLTYLLLPFPLSIDKEHTRLMVSPNVDHVANLEASIELEDYFGSVSEVLCLDDEADPEKLERILLCRRYLLDAGHDPTTVTVAEDERLSLFRNIITYPVKEALIDILNHGAPFVDVNTTIDDRGFTPLLGICEFYPCRFDLLDILLQRGANVLVTDHVGNSCLHLYFHGPLSLRGEPTLGEFADGAISLLRKGANVRAVNHDDRSVSDVAYDLMAWVLKHERESWGGVRGDVWDFSLASCGYNINEFRQGRVRKACYGELYFREDFERLWAGNEHLCPYFNDIEVFEDSDHSGAWATDGSMDSDEHNEDDDEDCCEDGDEDDGFELK